MTIPAHIAAHLEEARKAQIQWMHDLWTELAEDEMDALTPFDETCVVLFPVEKERVN